MSPAEKRALRAQHTCTLKTTSIGCRACDRGVPYPAMTIDEIIESLAAGCRAGNAARKIERQRIRRRR